MSAVASVNIPKYVKRLNPRIAKIRIIKPYLIMALRFIPVASISGVIDSAILLDRIFSKVVLEIIFSKSFVFDIAIYIYGVIYCCQLIIGTYYNGELR